MPAQNEARQGFAAGDFSDQLSEVVMGRRRAKIAFVGSAAGWFGAYWIMGAEIAV
jgi:hypothetical protein